MGRAGGRAAVLATCLAVSLCVAAAQEDTPRRIAGGGGQEGTPGVVGGRGGSGRNIDGGGDLWARNVAGGGKARQGPSGRYSTSSRRTLPQHDAAAFLDTKS